MAQDFAPLFRSIWGDEDFRALTVDAQLVYLMLFSYPDRNSAGVLPLTKKKWARHSIDMSVVRLSSALDELDDASFLVMDDETEEVLVRSFIRRAKVYTHIRLLANALRECAEVESERLRSALGQELVRLPKLAVPEHNERMAAEARAAQDRLDELVSIMCDAPPDPPGQGAAHGMGHGMADGIAHPPVVVAGVVAGAVAVAHPPPGKAESNGFRSLSNARGMRRCIVHDQTYSTVCSGCRADEIARDEEMA